VLNNWKKIQDAFVKNITYNCKGPKCKPSYYAYVYAGGKLEVFLCPQFWNAPDTGTDTKHGTLIHEISHEVAGTKDHAYGQTNCKNLASNSPDKAIENADNYEYFAEHYKVGSAHLKLTLLSVGGILLAEGIRRYRRSRSSGA
jgi:peptidyl-Lys metalloendopeptidase